MSEKDMVMELLEITQIQESGEVIFTDRSLEIIKELGEKYEQTALYRQARAENPDWEGDSNAGLLFVYMCERIAEAPSIIHMMMTPKLLLPIIWDKIQEETGQTLVTATAAVGKTEDLIRGKVWGVSVE